MATFTGSAQVGSTLYNAAANAEVQHAVYDHVQSCDPLKSDMKCGWCRVVG